MGKLTRLEAGRYHFPETTAGIELSAAQFAMILDGIDVSRVRTCKHLGIDPFAYLRDARPGLFALGDYPTADRRHDWLPDRWPLNRTRDHPTHEATAG